MRLGTNLLTSTTWLSGLVFLCLAAACFGLWPNAFKLSGSRWRFELFSFDFGIGALLISVILAYTLGTFGNDLGVSERLMVSSRTNQGLAVVSGGIFALGNMLLLSGISLLGLSIAFPLAIGTAFVAYSFLQFSSASLTFLLLGMTLLLVAIILSAAAARQGEKTLPGASLAKAARKHHAAGSRTYVVKKPPEAMLNSTKGLIVCVISGLALASFWPFLSRSLVGDFGLGNYAALLLFAVGLFFSTIVLNLYFMNIAIHGGSISFNSYFRGNVQRHLLGLGSGLVWALAFLAILLASRRPISVDLSILLRVAVPMASVAVAGLCGLLLWREHSGASGTVRRNAFLAIAFFLVGVVIFAYSLAHVPVKPAS